jgi:hypothetical protein
MLLALLDEHETAAFQRSSLPVDNGQASSVDDEQPLVGASVRILGASLAIAWRNDHLCGFRS